MIATAPQVQDSTPQTSATPALAPKPAAVPATPAKTPSAPAVQPMGQYGDYFAPGTTGADGSQYVNMTGIPSSVIPAAQGGTLQTTPVTPGTSYGMQAGAGSPPAAPGVSLTPTNPANDLRGQTITPGPMADRFAIAQSQLKQFNDATEPYYQKSLRDATSQAAGAGQLGSGMLRTSLGDLANQRNLQLETQGNTFLNDALSGSIDDAYKNLGIAQQQQGFQAGLQNQSFNQGVTQTQLQDALTNSSANRALQQLLAGEQGNPADTQLILSQLFGNQASQAGSALSGLIGNTVNRNAQQASTDSLTQLLQSLGLGGGGSSLPTTSGPIVPSTGGTATGGLFDPSSWLPGGL